MIKKNTIVIFQDGTDEKSENLIGGMPLSVGETVSLHKENETIIYEVIDKKIDCFLKDEDQEVNIIYTLKKKD